jgi:hypothetical protein
VPSIAPIPHLYTKDAFWEQEVEECKTEARGGIHLRICHLCKALLEDERERREAIWSRTKD